MKKSFIGIFLLILTNVVFVAAHGQEEIEDGRELVENKIVCEELTEEQLAAIGEYYMDLMHPGALHDAMHEMMGLEEGTEEHNAFHRDLAQRMYCGDASSGMMDFGGMGYGMMGMMYGSGFGYSMWGWWNIFYIVLAAVIFAVVFWGVYKGMNRTKGRK